MVAVLYELIEPKCESLAELASRTQASMWWMLRS